MRWSVRSLVGLSRSPWVRRALPGPRSTRSGVARRRSGTWFICCVAYGGHPRGSTERDRAATVAQPASRRPPARARRDRDRPTPPRSGTPPDRSRCGRATRTPAGDAGAGRRRGRGCARCGRAAVRPRPDPPTRRRHRRPATPATASRRSARTRSTVIRSTPLRPSSWRMARSPRGRARSRDSTQARANASSSSRPRSSSRSMAPSTRSGW